MTRPEWDEIVCVREPAVERRRETVGGPFSPRTVTVSGGIGEVSWSQVEPRESGHRRRR